MNQLPAEGGQAPESGAVDAAADPAASVRQFSVQVQDLGLWVDLESFPTQNRAESFARRLVVITRHEVARVVEVWPGAPPAPIAEFTKPPPGEEDDQARDDEEEAAKRRQRWKNVIIYGAMLVLVAVVTQVFWEKIRKVVNFLIQSWL